jgi:hypothetical protein
LILSSSRHPKVTRKISQNPNRTSFINIAMETGIRIAFKPAHGGLLPWCELFSSQIKHLLVAK